MSPKAKLGAVSLAFGGVRGKRRALLALLGESLFKRKWQFLATPDLPFHLRKLAARAPCGEPVKPLSFPPPRFLSQLLCRLKSDRPNKINSEVIGD
jgi:hypothetical protein